MMPAEAYDFHADLQYRGTEENYWRLDLAIPRRPADTPTPVLVLVHGGGWRGCDKRSGMEAALLEHYAERGFAVASVEYRLTGIAPFPAQLSDVMAAVQFLRAHAGVYKLDANRIAAAGHSAGGHLVALLGLIHAEEWCDDGMPYAEFPSHVQSVIALSGAYDLVTRVRQSNLVDALNALIPGPDATLAERARGASPITYVRRDAPAFLMMHGTEDPVCPVVFARAMTKCLRSAGARDVTLEELHGYGHELRLERIKHSMDAFLGRVFLED